MLRVLNELAVFLGVFGMLFILGGIYSYFAGRGHGPDVLNPKWGLVTNVHVLRGGALLLLCWLLILAVTLIDPGVSTFGPSFMWDRMSREKTYYDDSFFRDGGDGKR